ncbi:MAG: hypothetical protein FWH17_02265 [Oscillospiraceae bacterium]|nr:hypothetical protein [Oscillospiraceae bacterium]
MKTGNIGSTPNPYADFQNASKTNKAFETPQPEVFKPPVDTYTPSVKGAADPTKINSLWKELNHQGDAVRKLITSALGIEDAQGQGFWALRAKNVKLSDADRAQAASLVAEDGYFGAKQTTDRLIGFAKALVGEGASDAQIETMRKAVQKGFDEVAKMFGGFDKLPQVTKDTYEATMSAFDSWKSGTAATE